MAFICGTITTDILKDCATQPVGGVKSLMRLINFDDVLTITRDATNPLIVTGMVLKSTKKAFKYEVFKRGHKPSFTKKNGDYADRYIHKIDTSIQVWNNVTKAQVEGLGVARVIGIVENLQNTGDARFEIYGLDAGMFVADGASRSLNENEGVYVLSLASDELSLEPHIPASFWATDYPTTITAINTLDTAAT